jgi:hypothetical protein
MRTYLFITSLFLATSCVRAQVVSAPRQMAFVQLGTTGIGLGYHNQLNSKFAAGGNLTFMSATPTVFMKSISETKQHRITASAKYIDATAFLMWFPVGKEYYGEQEDYQFYFKGGLTYRMNADLSVRTDYQLKQSGNNFNNTDPVKGRLNVDIRIAKIQPFVLIGHQLGGNNSNLKFYFEWGASYHGKPKYTITQTNTPGITPLNQARIPQLLNGIIVYPILNAHIGYTF